MEGMRTLGKIGQTSAPGWAQSCAIVQPLGKGGQSLVVEGASCHEFDRRKFGKLPCWRGWL